MNKSQKKSTACHCPSESSHRMAHGERWPLYSTQMLGWKPATMAAFSKASCRHRMYKDSNSMPNADVFALTVFTNRVTKYILTCRPQYLRPRATFLDTSHSVTGCTGKRHCFCMLPDGQTFSTNRPSLRSTTSAFACEKLKQNVFLQKFQR